MEFKQKKWLVKVLKITGVLTIVGFILLYILPIIFADTITQKIRTLADKKLAAEINFSHSELSFFKHFPHLTLSLYDIKLNGSKPYENELLLKSKEISLGIDMFSIIFGKAATVDGIYIIDSDIFVRINEVGIPNYNIYIQEEEEQDSLKQGKPVEAALNLKTFQIKNSTVHYNDKSTKVQAEAIGFNYIGKGHFLESDVELESKAEIGDLDLKYEGLSYLTDKSIRTKLLTKFNTNSLILVIEDRAFSINELPVQLQGTVVVLKNGYDLNLNITTNNSKLRQLFTAFPPPYLTWLEQTNVKGQLDARLAINGQYISSENINPDIEFSIALRNGHIAFSQSPMPAKDISLKLEAKLPQSDYKKMNMLLDTLHFSIGDGYLRSKATINAKENALNVNGTLLSDLNLEEFNRAIGINDLYLKGMLKANIVTQGKFNESENSFPKTEGQFKLTDGWIKTGYYPTPIENIQIKAEVHNTNGTYNDTDILIDPASFTFEGEPFTLNAKFSNLNDVLYNIKAKGVINVAKVYHVFAQEGLDLDGYIKADVSFSGRQSDATNGNYNKLNNQGTLEVREIKTHTEYLPKPFIIKQGLFTFNQNTMGFNNFKGIYESSDFTMNGQMENVINFVLFENEILKGDYSITSNYINVNEFIASSSQDSLQTETPKVAVVNDTIQESSSVYEFGVIEIPSYLNMTLTADAKKVQYDEMNLENLKGNLVINDGQFILTDGSMDMIGANAKMDMYYKNEGVHKADFKYKLKLDDFDVQRAYNELKLFKTIAPAAEDAEGVVSIEYSIAGVLNHNMQPVLPSLEGEGVLTVNSVQLKGHKVLGAVSKQANAEDINDPEVSDILIKTKIDNNIVNIERFKIKAKGFRLRTEGQTSLDGQLNLKMRLGLPPFGIIGIPIKVTGTHESPEVKLGKKTKDLEEIDYKDVDSSNVEELLKYDLPDSIRTRFAPPKQDSIPDDEQAKPVDSPEEEQSQTKMDSLYQNIHNITQDSLNTNTTKPKETD